MSVCEIRGLCKAYPTFALKDVSFSLEAGTVTGFIGRNGAGKTTTIRAMLNLIHPEKGEVRYFGLPITGHEQETKQRLGFTAGNVNYYPRKKLRDIAAVAASFYSGWDEQAYRRYAEKFMLDENKTPSQLSEGMRVKFNLLLALSHHAELLILDEPTSGLDPFSRDELGDLLASLRDEGTTILFSTHITSDLEKCADRIVYIRNGQIVSADKKESFRERLGKAGETLEETMLRLEREARHA